MTLICLMDWHPFLMLPPVSCLFTVVVWVVEQLHLSLRKFRDSLSLQFFRFNLDFENKESLSLLPVTLSFKLGFGGSIFNPIKESAEDCFSRLASLSRPKSHFFAPLRIPARLFRFQTAGSTCLLGQYLTQ